MKPNAENSKQRDKLNPENNIDSPVNIQGTEAHNKNLESLTNDEDASVDPNEVSNKASFKHNENEKQSDTGRFDGSIGI